MKRESDESGESNATKATGSPQRQESQQYDAIQRQPTKGAEGIAMVPTLAYPASSHPRTQPAAHDDSSAPAPVPRRTSADEIESFLDGLMSDDVDQTASLFL